MKHVIGDQNRWRDDAVRVHRRVLALLLVLSGHSQKSRDLLRQVGKVQER
jgi:hypothetical protein